MIPENFQDFPFPIEETLGVVLYTELLTRVAYRGEGYDYIDEDEFHHASSGEMPRIPIIRLEAKVSVEFTYLSVLGI